MAAVSWHRHERRQRAVAAEADAPELSAVVRLAPTAPPALAAEQARVDRDPRAHPEALDAGAHLGDAARELVAQHDGRRGPCQGVRGLRDVNRAVQVLVEVRAAEAAGRDGDHYLAGGGRRLRDLVEAHIPRGVPAHRLHRPSSLLAPRARRTNWISPS